MNRTVRVAASMVAAGAVAVGGYLVAAQNGSYSLDAAYHAAPDGGTVYVPAGDYGDQTLTRDASKSRVVVIRPQPGATVHFSRVDFGNDQTGVTGPQHVILDRVKVDFTRVWSSSSDIQLVNDTGKSFDFENPSDAHVRGGDYGGCDQAVEPCIDFLSGSNVSVESVVLHDHVSSNLSCCHVDALFVRGANGFTIRGVYAYRNQITNVRFQDCCGLQSNQNGDVSGNWWGTPYTDKALTSPRQDGLDFDTAIRGLSFTGNVFEPGSSPQFAPGADWSTATVKANFFKYEGPCVGGVNYQANTVAFDQPGWGDKLCGTDKLGSWPFSPVVAAVPDPPDSGGGTTTTVQTTTAQTTTTAPTTTALPPSVQDLIDQGVTLLKGTTTGYKGHTAAWYANQTTLWYQGLAKLAAARAAAK